MISFFSSTGDASGREKRLLNLKTNDGGKSPMRRFFDSFENSGKKAFEDFTNPSLRDELERLDAPAMLQAFRQPNIFTAATNSRSDDPRVNVRELLAKTHAQRLQAFEKFARDRIPASIQREPKYTELFATRLDERDIVAYGQLGTVPSRIRMLLDILSVMQGGTVTDPVAADIGKRALFEKNNGADAPGTLVTMYENWLDLDKNRTLTPTQATNPEYVLDTKNGADPELQGLLKSINPLLRQSLLEQLYRERLVHQNDRRLANLDAEVDFAELNASVLKDQILKDTMDVATNFNNLDWPWKAAFIGLGAAAVYKAFKSAGILRYSLYGIAGYLAYDKLINGNANALNDMAGGLQSFAKMSKNTVFDLAESMGYVGPRNTKNRLAVMARFLEKNKLPIEIAATQNGLAALANVSLSTIAGAFRPNDAISGDIGGTLLIDEGDDGGLGPNYPEFAKDQGDMESARGAILYTELKEKLTSMGLRSDERDANIAYLQANSQNVGKAVSHVFYMLAADKTENQKSVHDIKEGLKSASNNLDQLPTPLKRTYMRLVIQGRAIAKEKYEGKSLMQVIASLNEQEDTDTVRISDTAVTIADPGLATRAREFGTFEKIRTMDADPAHYKEITEVGGLLDLDAREFIRNCVFSGLVKGGSVLDRPEDRADLLLRKKFDDLRNSERPLTEILEGFEKLKYAIFVASTRQSEPITKDQLIQMVGPDDLSASSVLATVEGFLGRYGASLPRTFQSVSGLADVQSLMNEPWFGSGPLSSTGSNFTKLREKVDSYQLQFAELRKPEVVAKRMVESLPKSTVNLLGTEESAILFIKEILEDSNFSDRMDRTEGSFSRRLAWALVRDMRLNANGQNYGDNLGDMVISRTEQLNLEIEFDRMFSEIVGSTLKADGMWEKIESIDMYKKYDLAAIEKMDFSDEEKRFEVIEYSRNLAIVYLLQKLHGREDPEVKENMADRIEKIYKKLAEQKKNELALKLEIVDASTPTEKRLEIQQKNLEAAHIIENQPSFNEKVFVELRNILKLLGREAPKVPSYDTLFPDTWFPSASGPSGSVTGPDDGSRTGPTDVLADASKTGPDDGSRTGPSDAGSRSGPSDVARAGPTDSARSGPIDPRSGPSDARSGPDDSPRSGPTDALRSGPDDSSVTGPSDPRSGPDDSPRSGPTDASRSGPDDSSVTGPSDARSGPDDSPRSGPTDASRSGPDDSSVTGPAEASKSGPSDDPRSGPVGRTGPASMDTDRTGPTGDAGTDVDETFPAGVDPIRKTPKIFPPGIDN